VEARQSRYFLLWPAEVHKCGVAGEGGAGSRRRIARMSLAAAHLSLRLAGRKE